MRRTDEMLAKALGGQAGAYPSLSNAPVYERKNFAENSVFYGQLMEDGYVFNPYIHRRWLPVQYNNLKDKISLEYLKENLKIDYIYNLVVEEIKKLYTLSKYDVDAYNERKEFFTIDICKEFLLSYCTGFRKSLNVYSRIVRTGGEFLYFNFPESMVRERKVVLKYNFKGEVYEAVEDTYTDRLILQEIDQYEKRIRNSDTYAELKFAIQKSIFGKNKLRAYISPITIIPYSFYEAFWKSGAYYSIKHKIMFEHKELDGKTGASAYQELRNLLCNGVCAEELHELYLNM